MRKPLRFFEISAISCSKILSSRPPVGRLSVRAHCCWDQNPVAHAMDDFFVGGNDCGKEASKPDIVLGYEEVIPAQTDPAPPPLNQTGGRVHETLGLQFCLV